MRRAERLFRLVRELRSRGICRAEDLAAHFEISVRTVYRDIAHLQGSGMPIEGEAGVGYLLRPGFDLPPMTFDHEQVDAIALGLAFVEVAGDAAIAEAAREVRSKIQASLPDPEKRKLENAPLFASRRDGPASSSLKLIRCAIRERRVLRLSYKSASALRSERRVRPLAIWAYTEGWLFAAWCEAQGNFRAFRLDRVMTLEDTGERFADDRDKSVQAYLASRFPNGVRRALRRADPQAMSGARSQDQGRMSRSSS